jgi:exopolyphosphatase/guanosine-5'-triphosphate,3'-diphosphate pyrophosphatase
LPAVNRPAGSPGPRLATIDLGSNTVRLLVVEVRAGGPWQTVDQDQQVTRLAEGLAASAVLGEAPMARTAAVVSAYVRRAERAGAGQVRIVATSAVREARNGAAFTAALERATGVPVQIISGEDEARLTVRGVLAGLRGTGEQVLAFDIGGGSTEFILAVRGQVVSAVSLRLGVVPLAERHPFPRRVEPERFAALEAEVRSQLVSELPDAILRAKVPALVGTAGTVTTLAALDLGLSRYDAARVQGHAMRRAAIEGLRDRLGQLDVAGRGALPCLEPGRADLIVPGVAIVLAALDALGVATLVASDWGLREGMMTEVIEMLS